MKYYYLCSVAIILITFVARSNAEDASQSSRAGFELQAVKDTSSATIKHSGETSGASSNDSWLIFRKWEIAAKAPLQKSSDQTDLANLDGLVNAFTMSVGWSHCMTTNDFDVNTGREFWDYGVKGSLGYENFKYLDVNDATEKEQDEYPWEIGAFIGYVPKGKPTYSFFIMPRIVLGATFQQTYKASDEVFLGSPTEGSDFVSYKKGAGGSPVSKDKHLLYTEMRSILYANNKMFPDGIGLAPRITYDAESEVWGVDLPVYFILSKNKELSGGIRIGWRDDTDDVTAGVFVGSSFSLWN